jgi:hypothetical protein
MSNPVDGVCWERMAEPQEDQYDTEVTLEMAALGGYSRPAGGSGVAFLGGAVRLHADPCLRFPDDCIEVDPSHPNVARAEGLLGLWPTVYRQCQRLLHTISLYRHTLFTSDQVVGSVCGPGTPGFGTVAVTVDHHVGFAEGIVHEMGHHKLRALGVDFERTHRLILNPPQEKYPSPIRYDCLRPMSAVLHAQYSYTYIIQLDLKILEARHDVERDRSIVAYSLAVIVPKLEFGANVLKSNAVTDESGRRFLAGLQDWTGRLLEESRRWLEEYGVAEQPFEHPILSGSSREV